MPSYKLHYFHARGRAEIARLCFAAAGVKYEDVRYTKEEWLKKKEEGLSPLRYLPVLEVDGKKLCETIAIVRYIAREHGLSPSDTFEIAQCDQVYYAFGDVLRALADYVYETDEERKEAYKKELHNTRLAGFMTNMEAMLKSNSDGNGFVVGDKLSYADLVVFHCCDMRTFRSAVENYPELNAHSGRIGEIPRIKQWMETRPDTLR